MSNMRELYTPDVEVAGCTKEDTNGLKDTVSVLDNNNIHPAYVPSDMLYDENFTDLQGIYHDEGFTVSDLRVSDFGEAITLTSTIDDFKINVDNEKGDDAT